MDTNYFEASLISQPADVADVVEPCCESCRQEIEHEPGKARLIIQACRTASVFDEHSVPLNWD
jgi:hypothetical protein